MEETHPLDTLPRLAGELAALVPRVEQGFAEAGVGERAGGGEAPLYLLGPVSWSWRFSLVREADRGFFLRFRRHRSREEVIVDVDLRLRLVPAPEPEPEVRLSEVRFELAAPPFVLPAPDEETLRRFVPRPEGARRADTILLRVGAGPDDVLAAWLPPRPADFRQVRLYYRGREVEEDGGFELAPFLALMVTLHDWLASGHPAGAAVGFLPFSDQRNEADRILRSLVLAYCRTTAVLSSAAGSPAAGSPAAGSPAAGRLGALSRSLAAPFAVAGFDAALDVRLDDDGTLAQERERNRFLLRVEVGVERDERTGVTARLAVLPPDFLISGTLHESFVHRLGNDAKRLGRLLDIDPRDFRYYLDGARVSAFRIRRKRRDRDVNLFLLRGRREGRPWIVLLRGTFRVDATADPPVVKRALGSGYELLYEGSSGAGKLDQDDTDYFKRLIGALKIWMEAVD